MSIDDDFYDVMAQVDGTESEEAFERLGNYMRNIEEMNKQLQDELRHVLIFKQQLREFMKDG